MKPRKAFDPRRRFQNSALAALIRPMLSRSNLARLCYHYPKRLAKCIIFCTILQAGISTSSGPRYQQRPDVLRYVEAEEAGEPKYGIHKAGREEELGVVKEW